MRPFIKIMDVQLEGAIGMSVRAEIVKTVLKFIMFDRELVPEYYDNAVKGSFHNSQKISILGNKQKTDYLENMKKVFDSIDMAFKRNCEDVLIIFGNNILCPAEIFHLEFPPSVYADLTTPLPVRKYTSEVIRELIQWSEIQRTKSLPTSTGVHLLFMMPRHFQTQESGENEGGNDDDDDDEYCDEETDEYLVPRLYFTIPENSQRYIINCKSNLTIEELSFNLNDNTNDLSGLTPLDTTSVLLAGCEEIDHGSDDGDDYEITSVKVNERNVNDAGRHGTVPKQVYTKDVCRVNDCKGKDHDSNKDDDDGDDDDERNNDDDDDVEIILVEEGRDYSYAISDSQSSFNNDNNNNSRNHNNKNNISNDDATNNNNNNNDATNNNNNNNDDDDDNDDGGNNGNISSENKKSFVRKLDYHDKSINQSRSVISNDNNKSSNSANNHNNHIKLGNPVDDSSTRYHNFDKLKNIDKSQKINKDKNETNDYNNTSDSNKSDEKSDEDVRDDEISVKNKSSQNVNNVSGACECKELIWYEASVILKGYKEKFSNHNNRL